jgi:hypothetical protein
LIVCDLGNPNDIVELIRLHMEPSQEDRSMLWDQCSW